jgi:penicillin-binding protein 2
MSHFLPPSGWRVRIFYVFMFVAAVALVGRLFTLQVLNQATYAEQALENRVSRVSIPAPRGIIYDSRGVPLALNQPAFDVVITPANLPDDQAQLQAIYARLATLLNMPVTVPGSTPVASCRTGPNGAPLRGVADLAQEGAQIGPFDAVKIKCDIPKDTALIIREDLAQMPGVDVQVEAVRDYPTGEHTADVVGYMAPIPSQTDAPASYDYYTSRGFLPGRDRIGVAGIEASMQDILAGQNGSQLVEKDVGGQVLRVLGIETNTVPGDSVQLTIDSRLQAAAEAALTQEIGYVNNYLGHTEAFAGVAIVMNPNNGKILAMVSWPSYDNSRFARSIDFNYYTSMAGDPERNIPADPMYPLLNHAVNVLVPPGSVFKIVTASGVLEENVIDPARKILDPGKITIKDIYYPNDPGRSRDFVCWDRAGHGLIDFVTAIAQSCNVYFYKVGGGYAPDGLKGLGMPGLDKWMNIFGFGKVTGVELPGELAGFIPSPDWKRITWGESWSTGDTYNAVIGQGYVNVTPLQMINAYNSVINGGWLYQPTLIDKILDGQGNVITQTQPILLNPQRLPLSQRTLDLTHAGMRKTVVDGTLSGNLNIYGQLGPVVDVPSDIQVAGKTGTAEYCDSFAYPKGWCIPGAFPTHAWTLLYAPAEKPEVSVMVFVYHGGEGSRMAAPIAGSILRAYFKLKQVDAQPTGGN